ncbi:NnrU family protein [Antarctobacter sp.]|uniref:NnrU family protein n=1 Tax=Antarctobacter sp. TaxID=1872577 RepID=UPI002B278272|nr:NnrU family protein [Antarctobacter sp.]
MSWTGFAAVFVAFFLTHSIPVRPAVKSRIVGVVGARGFTIGYSALSIGMLALLIWAAGQAPYIQLWPQMGWQRHLVHVGMLAVCLILALSIARPNPFSFGGARNTEFDPSRPGIVRWLRHPILLALALWAGLHLLPNGDLAHVILFGVLGTFAIAGRAIIDRRNRRLKGAAVWKDLRSRVASGPRFHAPLSWGGLGIRLGLAVAGFTLLLWMHPVVIGVSAL